MMLVGTTPRMIDMLENVRMGLSGASTKAENQTRAKMQKIMDTLKKDKRDWAMDIAVCGRYPV